MGRRAQWVSRILFFLRNLRHPWFAAAIVAASAIGGCGGSLTQQEAVPTLAWAACPEVAAAPFQCATASVALDHAQPNAGHIQLAVIRRPASDTAHRLGTIFFNPGGPGGAGTQDLPDWIDKFPPALLQQFDLISWDPRGTGRSTAVTCFDTPDAEGAFKARMAAGFPVGDTQVQLQAQLQAEFNQGCAQHSGTLLDHVSTADTARDLDLLRRAAGEPQLNYLGVSYGTLLGATYANLYPGTIRTMVLDGNVDPTGWFADLPLQGTSLRIDNDIATSQTLNAFLRHCGAAGPARCAFADADPASTVAKFDTLVQRLAVKPATFVVSGTSITFTQPIMLSFVAGALFTVEPLGSFQGWTRAASILQQVYVASGGNAPVTSSTTMIAARQALSALAVVKAAGTDLFTSDGAGSAIQCGESPNPRNLLLFPQIAAFAAARAGAIAQPVAWFDAPCSSWPASSASVYMGPWNAATAPLLVIGNIYDPSTAYSSSQKMAALLANARLLTVNGYGHTVLLNPSKCASDIESAYFINGTLPSAGTICEQDAVPFSD